MAEMLHAECYLPRVLIQGFISFHSAIKIQQSAISDASMAAPSSVSRIIRLLGSGRSFTSARLFSEHPSSERRRVSRALSTATCSTARRACDIPPAHHPHRTETLRFPSSLPGDED